MAFSAPISCDFNVFRARNVNLTKALVAALDADPAQCPCWSGNEYGCAIHGPLGVIDQEAQKQVAAEAHKRPRVRLSALAERAA